MKTSPLQLDESYVVEIVLKESVKGSISNFHPSDIRVLAEPKYLQSEENPLKWEVDLSVTFFGTAEKPLPYDGRLMFKGLFTISNAINEEAQKHIVAVNCPAMLYSSAREIVANLTGRGRFGRMLLPSITFIDERKRFDPPAPEPQLQTGNESEIQRAPVS
jgi:preprotein translocase subunit SecB